MVGLIIQARLGSKRLPNKMILPFSEGIGILELIIIKLKNEFPEFPIILATTENARDNALVDIAKMHEINVFRGEEENVLNRFINASKKFNLNKVIRICADNPFLNMIDLRKLIDLFRNSSFDYMSYITSQGIPVIKTHYGFWAEGVSVSALETVADKTSLPYYREHVTNYIYENQNNFKCSFLPIDKEIEKHQIRLTIDTKKDFETVKEIFQVINTNKDITVNEAVEFISQNKDWLNSMSTEIKQNSK